MKPTFQPKTVSADDQLDQVFHALADRTRRALLARLAEGPAMVTELAGPFDMSLPAVSKHVRVLEASGLLVREVDGRVHRCSLNAEQLSEAERWFEHYRNFWESKLDALAGHVEGRKNARTKR